MQLQLELFTEVFPARATTCSEYRNSCSDKRVSPSPYTVRTTRGSISPAFLETWKHCPAIVSWTNTKFQVMYLTTEIVARV